MTEAAVWFVSMAEGTEGPVTAAEIRSRLAAGFITDEWFVWREGMAEWMPIASMPELGAAPPSPPPMSPTPSTTPAPEKTTNIAAAKKDDAPILDPPPPRKKKGKARAALLILGLIGIAAGGVYFWMPELFSFAAPPPPEPVAPAGQTDAEIIAEAKKATTEFMITYIVDPAAAGEMLSDEGAAAHALQELAGTENLRGVMEDAWSDMLADSKVSDTTRTMVATQSAALEKMLATLETVRKEYQVEPGDLSEETSYVARLSSRGHDFFRDVIAAQAEWKKVSAADAAAPASPERKRSEAEAFVAEAFQKILRFRVVGPDRVAILEMGQVANAAAPMDLSLVPRVVRVDGRWRYEMPLAPMIANLVNQRRTLIDLLAAAADQPSVFSRSDLDAFLPEGAAAPAAVTIAWSDWQADPRFPILELALKAPNVPFVADLPGLVPHAPFCNVEIETIETRDGKNAYDATHPEEKSRDGIHLALADSALAGRVAVHVTSGTREEDVTSIRGRLRFRVPVGVRQFELSDSTATAQHAGATLRLAAPPGVSVRADYRGLLRRLVGFVLVDSAAQLVPCLVSGGSLTVGTRKTPLLLLQLAGIASQLGMSGFESMGSTGGETMPAVIDARLRPLWGAQAASVRAWIATDFVERIYPFEVTRPE